MPWRNGGGVTWEIARSPDGRGGDFDWRISIAEVAGGGPFSVFPGIDRVLVRIGIEPITLEIDGVEQVLPRFVPCAFAGEAATSARLPGGSTSDLNVMTRRGRIAVDVTVATPAAGEQLVVAAADTVAVIVLEGSPAAVCDGEPAQLELHDAVIGPPGGAAVSLTGAATVVVARFSPA